MSGFLDFPLLKDEMNPVYVGVDVIDSLHSLVLPEMGYQSVIADAARFYAGMWNMMKEPWRFGYYNEKKEVETYLMPFENEARYFYCIMGLVKKRHDLKKGIDVSVRFEELLEEEVASVFWEIHRDAQIAVLVSIETLHSFVELVQMKGRKETVCSTIANPSTDLLVVKKMPNYLKEYQFRYGFHSVINHMTQENRFDSFN